MSARLVRGATQTDLAVPSRAAFSPLPLGVKGELGPLKGVPHSAPIPACAAHGRALRLLVASNVRTNVLIVEDDLDIQESVAEILGIEGYSVTVANNGQEGLSLLARISMPCIILLDMMMPVMNGPEFLAHVKADPVLRACTVLIMTAGHAQPPAGAVGLIRKPFELPALLAFVKRHCS